MHGRGSRTRIFPHLPGLMDFGLKKDVRRDVVSPTNHHPASLLI